MVCACYQALRSSPLARSIFDLCLVVWQRQWWFPTMHWSERSCGARQNFSYKQAQLRIVPDCNAVVSAVMSDMSHLESLLWMWGSMPTVLPMPRCWQRRWSLPEMQILSNPVLCILHQLGWSKHVKARYFTGYLDIQKIFTISTGAGVCPNSVIHV